MPKIYIYDPANRGRNGWHNLYGQEADALNGNIGRVFLTHIPQSVPNSDWMQDTGYTCGPSSLAIALNLPTDDEPYNWLKTRGLISYDHGTDYSGMAGYLQNHGYPCDYDGRAHDGQYSGAIYDQIEAHLASGYKVILCMHTSHSRYWTNGGHYIVAAKSDANPSTYTVTFHQLEKGNKGPEVSLLQKLLKIHGLYKLEIDDTYGDGTVIGVKGWQAEVNIAYNKSVLAQDGIFGPNSRRYFYGFNGDSHTFVQIKRNDHGDDVRFMQRILQADGYYLGECDGSFGWVTYAAVVKFQKDHGLVADGICGPKTWSVLIGF